MSKDNNLKSITTNVVGVVLAAGSSKRMGYTKQLLPCGNQLLIEKVVHTAEISNLSQVIVVLGSNIEEILKRTKLGKAIVVRNNNFENGKSSSISSGLVEACKTECNAVMFILGDQPLITSEIINRLIKFSLNKRKSIIIPTYHGKRGNPTIFTKDFFLELMSLTGDIGGKTLMRRYKDHVIEVTFNSSAILFDLDTCEDYYFFKRIVSKAL